MLDKLEYTHLEKGDIVEIMAPAYGVHDRDLKKICEYIESLGLVARCHPELIRSITQIENLIFGRDIKNTFKLEAISKNLKPQTIEGDAVIGGNLKLVQCSISTLWEIRAENKILLFEDINEKPYQIDRVLTHIVQSGMVEGASAIVFGDFEGGDIEVDMPLIKKVLKRFAKSINIPVFKTSGIGHTKTNYAVWFGAKAVIDVQNNTDINLITSK